MWSLTCLLIKIGAHANTEIILPKKKILKMKSLSLSLIKLNLKRVKTNKFC